MTPVTFLDKAAALDLALRDVDQKLLRATVNHAHPKIVARLVRVRNDMTREWGQLWETRPVGMAK